MCWLLKARRHAGESRAEGRRQLDLAAFCLLLSAFFLPFVLYLFTLAPTVLNDDPAEYQMVLPALGVAHPTGYPLYTLLGHLFTRGVPIGDPAYRVNLFSALAAAAAIAVLYWLLCELKVAPLIALLGSLALAVSSDFWTYATIAQTYALNSLLMTLVLLAYVHYRQRRDYRSLVVLAFVTGLGFAHHSTFWLLAPALALALLILKIRDWRLENQDWRLEIRDWRLEFGDLPISNLRSRVLAMLALLFPLLVYLYIPLRGEQLLAAMSGEVLGIPQAVVSGLLTPHFLPGWTNVVLGSFYTSSTIGGVPVDWAKTTGDYLKALSNQFHGFEVFALGLIAPPVWRRQPTFVMLLIAAWLTNVTVVVRGVTAFNEPAGGLYTPTYLFCVIAIALVLNTFWRPVGLLLLVLFVTYLFWFRLWLSFNPYMPVQPTDFRGVAQRQFSATVAHALIFGAWSQVTPLHYLQVVEGVRPDVSVLQVPLASLEGRALMERALDERRSLYLLDQRNRLISIPLHQSPSITYPLSATFGNELTLLGYDLPAAQRRLPGTIDLTLYWRTENKPADDYKVFMHAFDAIGTRIGSRDRPPVSEYFPTHLWRTGQTFRDDYDETFSVAVDYLEIGLYNADTMKRLALPDGQTSVRIPWR